MEDILTELMDFGDVKITMPCDKLMAALSKMQATLAMAIKDSNNPYFKSKYADLATCINTAKKPLGDNELSVSQHCSFDGNNVKCTTVLGHSSGQFMSSVCVIPVTKQDAQGVGSAITYARRYSFSAVIGLSQEDDDGNMAANKGKQEPKPTATNTENEENWRLQGGSVAIKAADGKFYDIDKLTKRQLQKALLDDRFTGIKDFIEAEIAKK